MPKIKHKDYSIEFDTVEELVEFLKVSELKDTFNQNWITPVYPQSPYNPYLP